MENFRNNNEETNIEKDYTLTPTEANEIRAYEFTFPTSQDDLESFGDNESNLSSTPYYTPMEFTHTTFDFPSPNLDKHTLILDENGVASMSTTTTELQATKLASENPTQTSTQERFLQQQLSKPHSTQSGTSRPMQPPATPGMSRKLRRFSLYERRSCSPQHLLIRNSSTSNDNNTFMEPEKCADDKENTKPAFGAEKEDECLYTYATPASAGILNQSPSIIDESATSPKIPLSSNETASFIASSRLSYSPKLLNSINSLNLSGSPLGLISSAGYKNGNYFKFPEIDHVLPETADSATATALTDNQMRSRQKKQASPKPRLKTTGGGEYSPKDTEALDSNEYQTVSPKLHKKKSNNGMKVVDVPSGQNQPLSPSPKPKTPTIKSTKEKALSLDSAARESELNVLSSNSSYDEIDAHAQKLNDAHSKRMNICSARCAGITTSTSDVKASGSKRSTSLLQLTAPLESIPGNNTKHSTLSNQVNSIGINRTPRRRLPGATTSSEWMSCHRKYNPHFNQGFGLEATKKPELNEKLLLKDDNEKRCELNQAKIFKTNIYPASTTPLRSSHKHASSLYASSTNLKTLPEFLTLVEFSTTGCKGPEYPCKQKSVDLPSSSLSSTIRTKNFASTSSCSSTNLLQRRGSNHSLTLNLHGSCGNIFGSCRSGLNMSNYSLGSKSSFNLDISANNTTHNASLVHPNRNTTQDTKQSLFRRRGSNHSLTITSIPATSCGNINALTNQSSMHTEKCKAYQVSGVTRTTSFTTPTKCANSMTPKKGLLERRGSNQSLTLNMGSSFGGIGTDNNIENKNINEDQNVMSDDEAQRKFFSSESLNRSNPQFSDLNQAHKRDASQLCFGSVSDLKPSEGEAPTHVVPTVPNVPISIAPTKRDHFDFSESTICSCTGVRNIATRPLSPQSTTDEFKDYLANIQTLQNATKVLNYHDLIRFNYMFDNSYSSDNRTIEQTLPILNMHSSKPETPPGLIATSEDCEVNERYRKATASILETIEITDDDQKCMFRDLHKEFWELPPNHQEKPMVFGSQAKNRYKTILPNENSRVMLDREIYEVSSALDADSIMRLRITANEVPYINANYVKGPDYTSKSYIATQGPLPNTIYEFWLMVYQNTQHQLNASKKSNKFSSYMLPQYYMKIIMLTNILENNRQKCAGYFPIELNEILFSSCLQDTLQQSKELVAFFDSYLKKSETKNDFSEFKSEESTVRHSSAEITLERVQCAPEIKHIVSITGNFFVIKNIGIVRKNGYSIRKFVILYCLYCGETEEHLLINKLYCYHYWHPDWPDHRSPRDINTMLDLCLHVLNLGKCECEFGTFSGQTPTQDSQNVDLYQHDLFNVSQPPPAIHCSAGIGRTGCFIAILNAIRQLRQSLAYSLTSMASASNTHIDASTTAEDHQQLLSPVDFSLPRVFLNELICAEDANEMSNDTDSSFTRNTLLYIKYILQKKIREQQIPPTEMNSKKITDDQRSISTQIPELLDLPKIPDVFVDVLGIVCNLRLQRGGMVQNSEQYELIHRAICLYLKRSFALKRF